MIKLLLVIGILLCLATAALVPPVVLFHGLGDACSNSGFAKLTKNIEKGLNTYTTCIQIGNGGFTSFFRNFQKQAEQGCTKLKEDPKLQGDIQVVGLSQGALIARYIIQNCDFNGKVVRYISIGGPQMGVAKVPGCFDGIICSIVNWVVDKLIYFPIIQHNAGPAGYFRNPRSQNQYLKSAIYLPDQNNEITKNQTKYDRLLTVDMMLVMFLKDSVIFPRESQWFQFINENNRLISFFDTKLFKEDLLPLRSMYSQGRVKFVQIDGDHLRFTDQDLQNIFIPFLKGEVHQYDTVIPELSLEA